MSLNTVDLDDIQKKLHEKLRESGWADKLKTFTLSSDFRDILEILLQRSRDGKRFTPTMKQVFRAFEECPYKDLRVVIIGQDPYPHINVADGIAFSCSNTDKVQPSLRYIFKALETTVYKDGYTWDPDLTHWANQGVLLLNCAFTTDVGVVGQHYMMWRPFLAFLLDMLWSQSGMIYVFMGKKAQDYMDSVPENNYKFAVSHPASAAYNKAEHWECDDVFNEINKILQENNGEIINW